MSFTIEQIPWLVLASWLIVLRPVLWPVALITAAVFLSKVLSTSILFYLLLNITALIYGIRGSARSQIAIIQKITFLQLLGTGIALLGVAFTGHPYSIIAIFCGLLMSLPHVINAAVFRKYYEGLTLNGFLAAVVLPAFAGIEIIFKTRSDLKSQFPQLWEITLVTLGLLSFVQGSVVAYLSGRYRNIVQHLSLAWIGLLVFVLNLEKDGLEHLVLYMVAVFVVCAATLTTAMIYMRARLRILSSLMWLGLPGFVGFVVIYSVGKLSMSFNAITAILIILGIGLHAITLLRPQLVAEGDEELPPNWYVLVNGFLQLCAGIAFFWMGMGGVR